MMNMVGLRFWVPVAVFVAALASEGIVSAQVSGGGEACDGENLAGVLPFPYNDLSNTACKPLWNSYVLRFSQTKENLVTIILSASYTSGWVGIGFSKDGMMLNTSAMIGWISQKGTPVIKQYYVEGFSPSQIIPDKGELPLTGIPPFVTVHEGKIYLAYQLQYPTRLTTQPVLLAFATTYPTHHRLTHHDDKTTMLFDFSAGDVDYTAAKPTNNIIQTKKTHGTLGLIGWGLILPYGAIFARYFKHRDPLWYYLHVVFQFVGFIIAIAAVTVGISLYKTLNMSAPAHRGIGIFITVLSVLQVMAFFIRPDKGSKHRRYWNWYHHWVGRIALFFGALNIVLGIQLGNAGSGWKIGYGFLVSTVMLSCIVLEVLSKLRSSDKPIPAPEAQMDPLE